jgi:hypothetical protein
MKRHDKYLVSITYSDISGMDEDGNYNEESGYEIDNRGMDFDEVVSEIRSGGFTEPSMQPVPTVDYPIHLRLTSEGGMDTRGHTYTQSIHVKLPGRELSGNEWRDLMTTAKIL